MSLKSRLLAVLVAALLSGCAGSLKQSAQASVASDFGTTAVGIASGVAVEANPILGSPAAIVVAGVGRLIVVEHMDALPEPERTDALATMNAITWGITTSNIGVLLSASNPVSFAAGLIAAYAVWKSTEDEREFAKLCAYIRQTKPDMKCVFKPTKENNG